MDRNETVELAESVLAICGFETEIDAVLSLSIGDKEIPLDLLSPVRREQLRDAVRQVFTGELESRLGRPQTKRQVNTDTRGIGGQASIFDTDLEQRAFVHELLHQRKTAKEVAAACRERFGEARGASKGQIDRERTRLKQSLEWVRK